MIDILGDKVEICIKRNVMIIFGHKLLYCDSKSPNFPPNFLRKENHDIDHWSQSYDRGLQRQRLKKSIVTNSIARF
jgi:hypothetical protein